MNAPWRIVHVELSEPLRPLDAKAHRKGVMAVFWWHGIPLGQQDFHLAQLPLTPVQVREWAIRVIAPAVGDRLVSPGFSPPLPLKEWLRTPAHPPDAESLAGLEAPLHRLQTVLPPMGSLPTSADASVIVCTRNRPGPLKNCLRALGRLSCSPKEILVVDNAPDTGETERIVRHMPNVRHIVEPRSGLSIARNTGLRHTTGSIVAFTDDDVEVHPDWLGRVLGAFDNPRVISVTGLVLPAELETQAQLIFQQSQGRSGWPYRVIDYDASFFEQMKPYGVPVWNIGAGANMAFRREIFDQVGFFDERLGAGASGCSEDSELWYRVLAAGYTCRYEPAAAVFHYHRSDMKGLQDQMQQYIKGHVAALKFQYDRYGHLGNLYRIAGTLPLYFARLIVRRLLKGPEVGTSTLAAQLRGFAAGTTYVIRHWNSSIGADPSIDHG